MMTGLQPCQADPFHTIMRTDLKEAGKTEQMKPDPETESWLEESKMMWLGLPHGQFQDDC